jgi:hypothetical protein
VVLHYANQGCDEELRLGLGGLKELPDGKRSHVEWNGIVLKAGDEIRIKIDGSGEYDDPLAETVIGPEEELKRNQKYFEELKRELESSTIINHLK